MLWARDLIWVISWHSNHTLRWEELSLYSFQRLPLLTLSWPAMTPAQSLFCFWVPAERERLTLSEYGHDVSNGLDPMANMYSHLPSKGLVAIFTPWSNTPMVRKHSETCSEKLCGLAETPGFQSWQLCTEFPAQRQECFQAANPRPFL